MYGLQNSSRALQSPALDMQNMALAFVRWSPRSLLLTCQIDNLTSWVMDFALKRCSSFLAF
jgi:hypothetical protein